MTRVRAIGRVPTIVPGESFASYVERLAALHGVDLVVMLHYVGIFSEEKYERLNGYGILLNERQLENFSFATRMTKEQAANLLLSAFDGTAIDLAGVQAGDPASLRKRALDEWAYFSGSHVCPQCVVENGGAWQLAWKLPWTFTCIKHKCYLVPYCPSCERRFGSGRRDRSLSPVFVRHVPKLAHCNNPRPSGEAQIGKTAVPCGYPFDEIKTRSASVASLLVQKKINEALAGEPQAVLGSLTSPSEYFRDMRSLCALILFCAETKDLGQTGDAERAAFSAFVANRSAVQRVRQEAPSPRNSERTRVFIGPQEDPALMAAVSIFADKLLSATSEEGVATMLKPIAERCIALRPKGRWSVTEFFRFSNRLESAFQHALSHRASFNRSMGNRSVELQNRKYAFEPRHVPQSFWPEYFNEYLAGFFPEVGEDYARRFCSMSFVKLCGNYSWGEAAELLDLPQRQCIKMANRCVGFLVDETVKKQFARALHRLAHRLSIDQERIDHGERRTRFANLTDIPTEDWLHICARGGITPGHPGRRSRYAAVWLWSELTGGDWKLSPALKGENSENVREVYRQMCKTIIPKIETPLYEFGQSLLPE